MRLLLVSVRCVVLAVVLVSVCACGKSSEQLAEQITGGKTAEGKTKISHYGCASCHTIPGVRGADALVGPPLERIASRSYIGGVLNNTPDNMILWLKDPPAIAPKTAMPNMHITEADARDIASYLYTLK